MIEYSMSARPIFFDSPLLRDHRLSRSGVNYLATWFYGTRAFVYALWAILDLHTHAHACAWNLPSLIADGLEVFMPSCTSNTSTGSRIETLTGATERVSLTPRCRVVLQNRLLKHAFDDMGIDRDARVEEVLVVPELRISPSVLAHPG